MWQSRSIVLFVSLVCIAWAVLGLVGHDPWKPDEAYSFGLVLSVLEGHDWVVPMLAHEPFMEKPPVFYLTAALTAKAFHIILPLHDAARLASGLYMLLTLIVVGLTGRELFGSGRGWIATLMFVSSLGLVLYGHLLLTDLAQLTGFALTFYGLALALRRPRLGGLWLGTGVGLAFMSKGLLAPGCLGILVVLLPVLSPRWRTRDYARSVLLAILASAPWLLVWPAMLYQRSPDLFMAWLWDNNLGRFLGRNALGPRGSPADLLLNLVWFALPAWPLAFSTVWSGRRDIASRPELLLPLAGLGVIVAVLCVSRQERDLYLLPALVPLSLLAVPGMLSLGRDTAKAFSGGAIALFLVLGLAVWFCWAAMDLSVLQSLHERMLQFEPAYEPSVGLARVGLAIALMAGWVWVVFRFPEGQARPVVMWATGITMTWGLIAVLFTHYLDSGKSYRPMVAELKSRLPAHYRCIASHDLGEPQRAMLHYFAGVVTYREELALSPMGLCDVLFVQGSNNRIYQPDRRWVKIWEGSRPGDSKELYRLYQFSAPGESFRTHAMRLCPTGCGRPDGRVTEVTTHG